MANATLMLTAAKVKEYAGSKTQMNHLTLRRTMADKKDLNLRQKRMIDMAFKEVDQVFVQTEFGKIGLISLDEMPMQQMKRFMRAPSEEKMAHMMDFMKICLINPADWDKISNLPIKKLNVIIQSWMVGSESKREEPEKE